MSLTRGEPVNTDAALALVKELVVEMGVSPTPGMDVSEGATLRTDLGLSSLNLLILLVRIQERTGIEFAGQSRPVSSFQTVGDVVSVLVGSS